jgi:hypothetical protein
MTAEQARKLSEENKERLHKERSVKALEVLTYNIEVAIRNGFTETVISSDYTNRQHCEFEDMADHSSYFTNLGYTFEVDRSIKTIIIGW